MVATKKITKRNTPPRQRNQQTSEEGQQGEEGLEDVKAQEEMTKWPWPFDVPIHGFFKCKWGEFYSWQAEAFESNEV